MNALVLMQRILERIFETGRCVTNIDFYNIRTTTQHICCSNLKGLLSLSFFSFSHSVLYNHNMSNIGSYFLEYRMCFISITFIYLLVQVLSVLKDKKTTLKASLQGSSSTKYGNKPLSWELRKVPSGPDPLHHNGVNPKKPQTP